MSSDSPSPSPPSVSKIAVIVGIGSRRGIALARYLAGHPSIGYQLHAFSRWQDVERLRNFFADLSIHVTLHTPNISDSNEIIELLRDEVRPDEVYNLHYSAAASSPFDERQLLFEESKKGQIQPTEMMLVDSILTLRLLEAIRIAGLVEKTRFFQEQRVSHSDAVALETPSCHFDTPNACSKMFSHLTIRRYRERRDMFAVNGSFFEKILACDEKHSASMFADDICQRLALQFAEMHVGHRDLVELELGDNETVGTNGDVNVLLDRRYEWSHGGDLAEAMWLALNSNGTSYKDAKDFIIATRQFYSLRDFCEEAFSQAKSTPPSSIEWHQVSKRHTVAKDAKSGATLSVKFADIDPLSPKNKEKNGPQILISTDRPSSSSSTESDCNEKIAEIISEASRSLNWEPKRSFSEIVAEYLKFAELSLQPLVEDSEINADVPADVGANLLLLED